LYNVIGKKYGGDSINRFGLPDQQGRVPVGAGQGAGLTNRVQGFKDGAESVTLNASQMPAHNHTVNGLAGRIESNTPKCNFLPEYVNTNIKFYGIKDKPTDALLPMNNETVAPAGSSLPHNNMPPFLTLTLYHLYSRPFPCPTLKIYNNW
jgi:microcystin-dependent protein